MEKIEKLSFNDKDIMFDAFVECIANNYDFLFGNDGAYTALCFIEDCPSYVYTHYNNRECYIYVDLRAHRRINLNNLCKVIIERLCENNKDYTWYCKIGEDDKIIVTAETIINE